MTNLERYKADLARLLTLGSRMAFALDPRTLGESEGLSEKLRKRADELAGAFEAEYQRWYSESLATLCQLLPARLAEFESLYKDDKRKDVRAENYSIQDWLLGRRPTTDAMGKKLFDDLAAVTMRFQAQRAILKAVEARFESSLFDIRQLVQADLFDSELDAARELIKAGFLRAGGIVAGVVLEKHLEEVCEAHAVTIRKKTPTIGDFNDALKEASVMDIPAWRQIQRLADLRNLCGHNKDREPTKDEVSELVDGCEKITKTLY